MRPEKLFPVERRKARSERIGNGLELAQLRMSEVRPRLGDSFAFARDLQDSDDVGVETDRRAHNLLNRVAAYLVGDRHAFKDRSVTNHGKVVNDLRPLFANRAGGERVVARERNLPHHAQRSWHEKAQVAFIGSKAENSHFMVFDAEFLAISSMARPSGEPSSESPLRAIAASSFFSSPKCSLGTAVWTPIKARIT